MKIIGKYINCFILEAFYCISHLLLNVALSFEL